MTVVADVVKMVNTSILVGILVGVFLAGIGGAYAIFANTYGPAVTMQNPQMMNQWLGSMMQDPTTRQQMMSGMMNQVPQDVIVKITSSQKVSVGKEADRKSTRLNSSHIQKSRMPSSA